MWLLQLEECCEHTAALQPHRQWESRGQHKAG